MVCLECVWWLCMTVAVQIYKLCVCVCVHMYRGSHRGRDDLSSPPGFSARFHETEEDAEVSDSDLRAKVSQ